jgi:uncharacterized membrane protein
MAKKTTTTTKKKTTTRKTAAPRASSRDAENNKAMALIAYIGILCLIPILTGDYKKSPFVKFHTNQGVVLFITWIAWWFLSFILGFIFRGWFLGFIFSIVSFAVWVMFLVLVVLGIINAVNGRMKPLPLIGNFEIIK